MSGEPLFIEVFANFQAWIRAEGETNLSKSGKPGRQMANLLVH
jgi:hypothetical protein